MFLESVKTAAFVLTAAGALGLGLGAGAFLRHGQADESPRDTAAEAKATPASQAEPGDHERIVALEKRLAELERQVAALSGGARPASAPRYDPNRVTKVRPRFDARVDRVFVGAGEKVKKGDPLVELYSTDLAQAKTDLQTKFVQWRHDRKLYELREKLVETGAISQQLWVDSQNDERKSRLDYNIALDKLLVFYEVPREEIDPLLEGLDEKAPDPRAFGRVNDKARLTLRAKNDGIVIERDVVVGDYYKATDVLMLIAPNEP
jgi:cobalt-zinc-cadmium efflux system membrane fusion protein